MPVPEVWVHTGARTAAPLGRKQMLTHWTSGLCNGVKLQGFHRAPPSNLTRGFNQSLRCKEMEDLQIERNGTGEGMAKAAGG